MKADRCGKLLDLYRFAFDIEDPAKQFLAALGPSTP
jgi:hypothetical protein